MSGQTSDVAAQVAVESAKRTAKKAAQARKRPAAGGAKVKVVMTQASRGIAAGARRTLDKDTADTLIRQGHARKA